MPLGPALLRASCARRDARVEHGALERALGSSGFFADGLRPRVGR
ncbi:MAG TPA: hypothetical protein VHS09_08260 [Polyangiaceae bacterium]|nr:hypothetical protein [Polyangiaceae bacterium]